MYSQDYIFRRFIGILLRTPKESLCTELYKRILSRDQKLCSLLFLMLIASSFPVMFFEHPFILPFLDNHNLISNKSKSKPNLVLDYQIKEVLSYFHLPEH
jgi:hypothetical protein